MSDFARLPFGVQRSGAHANKVGSYAVERELGRGGMGIVYLATDQRLGRRVALKALPAAMSADGARKARLEREARVLASVKHPNVATIHGVEEQDGTLYLVLEYIEGETLSEKLSRGAIPVAEAVKIGVQIAAGLEAAHEAGVVHRDLKPANVRITPDGLVKVLDFGLAKGEGGSQQIDLSQSPTMDFPSTSRELLVTQSGVIMGTAGYMSPEQARGRAVDKRTDIWSFGCVLFECVAGKPPFGGETMGDLIVSVLEREPNLDALPASVSVRLRELLRRCLEKDSRKRLRDIGDARIELEAMAATREWGTPSQIAAHPMVYASTSASGLVMPRAGRGKWAMLGIAVAGLAVGAGGVLAYFLSRPKQELTAKDARVVTPQLTRRLTVELSREPLFKGDVLLLTNDGKTLVYGTSSDSADGEVRRQLWARDMDRFEPRAIAGTEGYLAASLSPDGASVLFIAREGATNVRYLLKKVAIGGGAPVMLVETDAKLNGVSWMRGDQILLTASEGAEIAEDEANVLFAVPSRGGELRRVFSCEDPRQRVVRPDPLPGGQHALLTVLTRDERGRVTSSMEVVDLSTAARRLLVPNAAEGRYVEGGHVVFARGSSLLSVPFDPATRELRGEASAVVGGLDVVSGYASRLFDVSASGDLAYVPGTRAVYRRQLILVERETGAVQTLPCGKGFFIGGLTFSPDGTRIAAMKREENGDKQLWVYDLKRGTPTRLAAKLANASSPVWLPDGSRVVFTISNGTEQDGVYVQRANGGAEPERWHSSGNGDRVLWPMSATSDGLWILADRWNSDRNQSEVVALATRAAGELRPIIVDPGGASHAKVSPDGRWVAYESTSDQRAEVVVRALTTSSDGMIGVGADRYPVHRGLAMAPAWAGDSKRLFFQGEKRRMYEVVMSGDASPTFSPAEFCLDKWSVRTGANEYPWHDATSDGRKFVLVQRDADEEGVTGVNVVLGWAREGK